MHELALDAHAAQDPAVALAQPDPEPRAPGEVSSALVATRRGGGAADERGLADDATLLRAMQAALADKRAIAGWPDGKP